MAVKSLYELADSGIWTLSGIGTFCGVVRCVIGMDVSGR